MCTDLFRRTFIAAILFIIGGLLPGIPEATAQVVVDRSPVPGICGTLLLQELHEPDYRLPAGALRQPEIRPRVRQNEVGDTRTFKVHNFVTKKYDNTPATLRSAGRLSYIWVADDAFGSGKVTQNVVNRIQEALEDRTPEGSIDPDRGIISISQEIFGMPPDVDGSGKLHVLIVDIQDGWSTDAREGYTSGFVNSVDLSLTNANSNKVDIIYVDSNPGIYGHSAAANFSRTLATLAHEYQHIIHFRYRNLVTFQDEGQAEWSTILHGYPGRAIDYLNNPHDVNRSLYFWSTEPAEVLKDYQRAGLLHSYIADRVGPIRAGSITRAPGGRRAAYEKALASSGVTWPQMLGEFHVANWINDVELDPRYGHRARTRGAVRARQAAGRYINSEQPVQATRTLQYGAAEYTEWFGISDLELTLSGPDVMFYLITRELEGGLPRIRRVAGGHHLLDGSYESIVLAAINTGQGTAENSTHYVYSARWTPFAVRETLLDYAAEAAFFTELSRNAPVLAMRISPAESGFIQEVDFQINGRTSAITGDGTVRLILARSENQGGQGAAGRWFPSALLDSIDVPFSRLRQGDNNLYVRNSAWAVQGGHEYHVMLRLVDPTPDAKLELLLDGGATLQSNTNYWPARTLRYQPAQQNWGRYTENNNLLLSAKLVSLTDWHPGETPVTEPFVLLPNYPNPFSFRTTLQYDLHEEMPVRIDLFDAAGRRVQTLVDAFQSAGRYLTDVDGARLASGVYVIRMAVGSHVITRSIMVVK